MADVSCEIIVGPITFGIANKQKRLKRVFLEVSKEAATTMYVSVSMGETAAFGTEKAILPGTELSMQKTYVPLAVGELSVGDALRIKVRWVGVATIYDVGVEIMPKEAKA